MSMQGFFSTQVPMVVSACRFVNRMVRPVSGSEVSRPEFVVVYTSEPHSKDHFPAYIVPFASPDYSSLDLN